MWLELALRTPTSPMNQPTQFVFCLDGDADWIVRELRFTEVMSRPYEITVELERDLDLELQPGELDAILGCDCILTIDGSVGPRVVRGKLLGLRRWTQKGGEQRTRARVGPALALATHTRHSRTFSEQSVEDVVDGLLCRHLDGRRDCHDWRLCEDYPIRELIVQYEESDLVFMSRLLEVAGIAYHFTPEPGSESEAEVMILDDSGETHHPVPTTATTIFADDGTPTIDFIEHDATTEGLLEFAHDVELTIEAIDRRNYDWETNDLRAHWGRAGGARGGLSVRQSDGLRGEVPGAVGAAAVQTRAELDLRRYQQQRSIARGRSTVPGFAPGRIFHVRDYGTFLLTEVTHQGELGPSSSTADYVNEFECVRIDETNPNPRRHVPLRRTPTPRMGGAHTALVLGANGSDVTASPTTHTDEKGRVKVRFHWEREADDDGVFAWLRVAQTWSGGAYGFVFVPRVGMEVVVDFLHGNPDSPVIVGCVYDDRQSVTVEGDLSASETRSWIRTRSEDGAGFNEILFDDARGQEMLHVRAQRDRHEEILNNQVTDIGGNNTVTVSSNHAETIHGARTESIASNASESVGGKKSIQVKGDLAISTESSGSIHTDGSLVTSSGSSLSLSSGDTFTISGAKATGTLEVTDEHLKIECGSTSIKLEPGGLITIKGIEVVIETRSETRINGSRIKLNCG